MELFVNIENACKILKNGNIYTERQKNSLEVLHCTKKWLNTVQLAVLRFPRVVILLPITTLFENRMERSIPQLFLVILLVKHIYICGLITTRNRSSPPLDLDVVLKDFS